MQELINRTSGVAESMFSSALDVAYLASYFGFSYIALSLVTSFLSRMVPGPLDRGSEQ